MTGPACDHVESDACAKFVEIGHRRDEPSDRRLQADDRFEGAGSADHVADHPFWCGHRRRAFAKDGMESVSLGFVVQRGGGAVRVDMANVVWLDPGILQCEGHAARCSLPRGDGAVRW